MQPRILALMAVGVFALCSSAAMAQGHAGGYENSGVTASAVAYHGGHYGYRYGGWGGYRGAYGYGGWYGPSVGLYAGVPAYAPWAVWGYPYYPGAVYDPSAAIPYPADAPPAAGSFSPPDEEQATAPSGYWYYCANPAGYYPYVQQCNSGWTPVAPQDAPLGR
jgi:hypothetical protein